MSALLVFFLGICAGYAARSMLAADHEVSIDEAYAAGIDAGRDQSRGIP